MKKMYSQPVTTTVNIKMEHCLMETSGGQGRPSATFMCDPGIYEEDELPD